MRFYVLLLGISVTAMACSQKEGQSNTQSEKPEYLEDLTFYAPFDDSVHARYAAGDHQLYSAMDRRSKDSAQVGLTSASHITVSEGTGKYGNALKFGAKVSNVAFFKSEGNIAYDVNAAWNGTVSFWLQLNPNEDLEPGYCDPIQITDVNYNDASIWVDFTRDSLRKFRLGVIGDLVVWDPDTIGPNNNPAYEERLAVVDQPPFSRSDWTHVAITYSNLNTDAEGIARLYLNGMEMGVVANIKDPFTWELAKSNIFLGLNYIGLMDELAIFNRALTSDEIKSLNALTSGISEFID